MKYQITIRSGFLPRNSVPKPGEQIIGHSSVVLHSPAGAREYNVAVNNYDKIKGKPLRSLATGIPATIERVSRPINLNRSTQTTISVSPHQYLRAKLYAERQANRGTFNWHAGNNCAHFTHNTVRSAGINAFTTNPFSSPEHTQSQINKLKTNRWLKNR